jgi:hypothetical protein
MHHFCTVVYLTLSDKPDARHVWQFEIPKEAIRHRFLMHSVLGLSALHLLHVSPQNGEAYRRAAIRHQDTAVGTFRPLLENINPDNCAALWASSALTLMFGAAQYQVPEAPGVSKLSPTDGILEVCELVRGVLIIHKASIQWMSPGPFKPILGDDPIQDAREVPVDVIDALQAVKECINNSSTTTPRSVYLSSLQLLHQTFEVTITPDQPGRVFLWLVLFERQFLTILRERDPVALVMLAHYGVVLHRKSQHWWCGNWGFVIVRDVYNALGEDWRPFIAWPAQKVGFDPNM